MKKIGQKTIALVFWRFTPLILVLMIGFFLSAYVYFANMAVRKVTLLHEATAEAESLSSKVSDLESLNFSIENKINIETAVKMGLAEAGKPLFIVKSGRKTAAITLNDKQ